MRAAKSPAPPSHAPVSGPASVSHHSRRSRQLQARDLTAVGRGSLVVAREGLLQAPDAGGSFVQARLRSCPPVGWPGPSGHVLFLPAATRHIQSADKTLSLLSSMSENPIMCRTRNFSNFKRWHTVPLKPEGFLRLT